MKPIFTILFLGVFSLSNAQWNSDATLNTLVASSISDDSKSIGTSDGKTIIVFWKSVDTPNKYELRIQKLNSDGTKAFGNEGLLVSDAIPMSSYTSMWSINIDGGDNVYLGITGTGDYSGHIFKIDPNGNNLWGSTGISLGIGMKIVLKPLSTGELAASWIDDTNKANLQKFTTTGEPVWTTATMVVSGTSKTAPEQLFEMSNGDILAVFHTFSSGIASKLRAQKYNSSGAMVWPAPKLLSNLITNYNREYSGAQDGDTVYFAYFADNGTNRLDSYLQRINPDGTLPWGINGKDFDINQTNFEGDTKISFQAGSQYVWALCSYSNPNQTAYGEYVQKFDKDTGDRQFTDNAKNIFPIDGNERTHVSKFYLVNDSPLFLLKSGKDNGATPVTLSLCHLNSTGGFAWAGITKPMATFSASKLQYKFNKPVNGTATITFSENKGDGIKIYAHSFTDAILGIKENKKSKFDLIYPNPVQNKFNLKSSETLKYLEIYDVSGKRIISSINRINSKEIVVNASFWPKGIYLLNIATETGGQKMIKVIKK